MSFRAKYPWVKTQIFEISPFEFTIFVPLDQIDITTIVKDFDESIRPLTLNVQLTNQLPNKFLHEIPVVSDEELGQQISLSLNRSDFHVLISAQFPDFPDYVNIMVNGRELTIVFADLLSQDQFDELQQWTHSIEPEIVLKVNIATSSPKLLETDILRVLPPKMRAFKRPYVVEDEDFWHENVRGIYRGELRPHDVINLESWGTSCLIDATTMETIDLRQALLCFDTIILNAPLLEGAQAFRDRQRISDSDLATLAKSDRLRLVMQQPEERLDWKMVDAVLEANHNAVIGRRRSSALVAADIVETSEHYLLSTPELIPALQVIAEGVSDRLKLKAETVLRSLLWPVTARRASFEKLSYQGLMGVGGFSVGNEFSKGYEDISGRDVRLEAMIFGASVNVAHAFNATLIPPENSLAGWNDPMRMMGEWLNFYRSFNNKIAPAWIGNQYRRASGAQILPAIPMFTFERHAAISDILDFTCVHSDRNKGRSLVSRLASLPKEQRTGEMDRLSKELFKRDIKHGNRKIAIDLAQSGTEIAAYCVGLDVPPIGSIISMLLHGLRQVRKIAVVDSFLESLEADLSENFRQNQDLDFLSKVYRVAKLIEPPMRQRSSHE